jgi:hypothetical protein
VLRLPRCFTVASLAALAALAGCARGAAPSDECTGVAPTCFEAIAPATACCAEAGVPAECGPKDAPRGTLLKWVCPGKTVRAAECAAYGAVCAAHVDQVAPSLATPHAVPFDGAGAGAGLPAGWQDAAVGTTLVDRSEPLGPFYTLRSYTTRVAGPDAVKDHRDVYFGKDRLTERRYFLAPTSDYLLFEDGPNKLAVHGAVSGKRRDATPKPYEAPAAATFDAQKKTVVVTFAKHAPLTVRLP